MIDVPEGAVFPKNFLYVDVDLQQNLKYEIETPDGVKDLIVENKFNRTTGDGVLPLDECKIPHEGVLVSKPIGLSRIARKDGIDLDEISEGDRLAFHHFLISNENRVSNNRFFFSYFRDMVAKCVTSCYAKIEGDDIVPIHKWSLVEIVKSEFDKESTIIVPESIKKNHKVEKVVKMVKPSRFLDGEVFPGDEIAIDERGLYSLTINGDTCWFVHTDDVLMKFL